MTLSGTQPWMGGNLEWEIGAWVEDILEYQVKGKQECGVSVSQFQHQF